MKKMNWLALLVFLISASASADSCTDFFTKKGYTSVKAEQICDNARGSNLSLNYWDPEGSKWAVEQQTFLVQKSYGTVITEIRRDAFYSSSRFGDYLPEDFGYVISSHSENSGTVKEEFRAKVLMSEFTHYDQVFEYRDQWFSSGNGFYGVISASFKTPGRKDYDSVVLGILSVDQRGNRVTNFGDHGFLIVSQFEAHSMVFSNPFEAIRKGNQAVGVFLPDFRPASVWGPHDFTKAYAFLLNGDAGRLVEIINAPSLKKKVLRECAGSKIPRTSLRFGAADYGAYEQDFDGNFDFGVWPLLKKDSRRFGLRYSVTSGEIHVGDCDAPVF